MPIKQVNPLIVLPTNYGILLHITADYTGPRLCKSATWAVQSSADTPCRTEGVYNCLDETMEEN